MMCCPARALTLLVLVAHAGAQRGSPFRCRDRDPACAQWASRGECSNVRSWEEKTPAATLCRA